MHQRLSYTAAVAYYYIGGEKKIGKIVMHRTADGIYTVATTYSFVHVLIVYIHIIIVYARTQDLINITWRRQQLSSRAPAVINARFRPSRRPFFCRLFPERKNIDLYIRYKFVQRIHIYLMYITYT